MALTAALSYLLSHITSRREIGFVLIFILVKSRNKVPWTTITYRLFNNHQSTLSNWFLLTTLTFALRTGRNSASFCEWASLPAGSRLARGYCVISCERDRWKRRGKGGTTMHWACAHHVFGAFIAGPVKPVNCVTEIQNIWADVSWCGVCNCLLALMMTFTVSWLHIIISMILGT